MTEPFNTITMQGEGAAAVRLPESSLMGQLLAQYAPIDFSTWEPAQFETIIDYATETPAFLTVVTRTVGKRLLELEEVLVCLASQTDQDFEFCLVGHNLEQDRIDVLRELVEAQPESLRKRIKFIVARGEGRARPLNAGFCAARSEYAAILDDDDLVYDNWVELFHKAAQEHPGRIIHCGVIDQEWKMTETPEGDHVVAAIGSPGTGWCCDFNTVEQFGVNRCPIMSLAFPLFPFKEMGVVFDEGYTTTEDWDFLMRTSFVCGVENVGSATSIYRLWNNADNSKTEHDGTEWAYNRLAILDGFRQSPLLVPGSVTDTFTHASAVERDVCIFLDLDTVVGDVLDAEGRVIQENCVPEMGPFEGDFPRNRVFFRKLTSIPGAHTLRVRIPNRKLITLWGFAIYLGDGTNEDQRLDFAELDSNGIVVSPDEMAFIAANPWFDIPLTAHSNTIPDDVVVSFLFRPEVDQALLEGSRLVIRAKNKLDRMRHRKRR